MMGGCPSPPRSPRPRPRSHRPGWRQHASTRNCWRHTSSARPGGVCCSPAPFTDRQLQVYTRPGRGARVTGAAAVPDRRARRSGTWSWRSVRGSSCRGRRPRCWSAGGWSGCGRGDGRGGGLCAGFGGDRARRGDRAPGARVYAVERDPPRWTGCAATFPTSRRRPAGRPAPAGDADPAWAGGAGPGPVALPVTVVAGDVTDPAVLAELDGRVDLVLCNPPYVPRSARPVCPPRSTEHDPHVAVFGGADGLDVIRPLIARVAALLRPGGAARRSSTTRPTATWCRRCCAAATGAFADVELHHDLARRRPRFTTATRAPGSPRVADWRP